MQNTGAYKLGPVEGQSAISTQKIDTKMFESGCGWKAIYERFVDGWVYTKIVQFYAKILQ